LKKILIIQTAFIGDVILATPIIEKLNQHFPDAKIDFLLRKGNEGLLQGHPYINELIIWNKTQSKYKNLFQVIKKIRGNKYDYLINVQRFASTGLITILSGAKTTVGFNKNPFSFLFTKSVKHVIDNKKHETERNTGLIQGITDNSKHLPKLYPSEQNYKNTKKYKSSAYICIAPTSVWFTKQYPQDKWIEFINQIDSKYTIYFIGSKDDFNFCQGIIDKLSERSKQQNLAGKLSFLETAALMKDAKMNYVNDSAPMHIASAMNATVTAIFCSTTPVFGFGPLSNNSFIIETTEELGCRPCGLHGLKECPEKHFKCAYNIKKEQLLEKI